MWSRRCNGDLGGPDLASPLSWLSLGLLIWDAWGASWHPPHPWTGLGGPWGAREHGGGVRARTPGRTLPGQHRAVVQVALAELPAVSGPLQPPIQGDLSRVGSGLRVPGDVGTLWTQGRLPSPRTACVLCGVCVRDVQVPVCKARAGAHVSTHVHACVHTVSVSCACAWVCAAAWASVRVQVCEDVGVCVQGCVWLSVERVCVCAVECSPWPGLVPPGSSQALVQGCSVPCPG